MTPQDTMRLALEALELHAKQYPHMQKGYTVDAIEALRSALSQQGEPVEYQSFTKPGFMSSSSTSWEPCTPEQYHEYLKEGTPVRALYVGAAPAAQPCKVCEEVHAILDTDESMIIRDAKDGYPEGRASRTLTLQERVKALCVYAADWKRWYEETQAAPAPQAQQGSVAYVPVDSKLRDANGNHPNDTEDCDQQCQEALDARGDDKGQGLDGYWKWGFKAGWNAAKRAAPQAQQEPDT